MNISSRINHKNARFMNVFADCESTRCVAIWYQLGSKAFDPNIINILKDTEKDGAAAKVPQSPSL